MLPDIGTTLEDQPHRHREEPRTPDQPANQSECIRLDPSESLTDFICFLRVRFHRNHRLSDEWITSCRAGGDGHPALRATERILHSP